MPVENLVAHLVIGMHRARCRVVLIDAHDVGIARTDLTEHLRDVADKACRDSRL